MAVNLGLFDLWQPGYGEAVVTVFAANGPATAALFYDEAATQPAPNPFTLLSLQLDGYNYGRSEQAVYVADPTYSVWIDGMHGSGIYRPALQTLAGADLAGATVKVAGSTFNAPLDQLFAEVIHVRQFGQLISTEADLNTNIINLALAKAAGRGGGRVVMPAGTYAIRSLSLSRRVLLEGSGKDVTILTSQYAGNIIAAAEQSAGIKSLTIDGQTNVLGSRGFRVNNFDSYFAQDVRIRRCEVGLRVDGSKQGALAGVDLEENNTGAFFYSDDDVLGNTGLTWTEGYVANNITYGILFRQATAKLNAYHRLSGLYVRDNLGDGIRIEGARNIEVDHSQFEHNGKHLRIRDYEFGDPDQQRVQDIVFVNSAFGAEGGIHIEHTAQDIRFVRSKLDSIEWTFSTVGNGIVLEECLEMGVTTIAGDPTLLQRQRDVWDGATTYVTNDSIQSTAWRTQLLPGQSCTGRALVNGNALDAQARYAYVITFAAYRPAAALNYDNQTSNFTVGDTITGSTSHATGRLLVQTDDGSTGVLRLRSIAGTFVNNENITGALGGSARTNGTISTGDMIIQNQVITDLAPDADARADIKGQGDELTVAVTGVTGKTIEWTVNVDLVMST
jgi:hypothetical protein